MIEVAASMAFWAALYRGFRKHVVTPMLKLIPPNEKTGQPSGDSVKFAVSAWKGFSFTLTTLFGFFFLSQESWVLHPRLYLAEWPHEMTVYQYFYYILAFGNVAHYTYTLTVEPKQKDFMAMIIHHAATLYLIIASHFCGFHRIGCIVLILHDFSDPLLEFAKCALYLKWTKISDFLFTAFAVAFFVTRLMMYPAIVVVPALRDSYFPDGTPYFMQFYGLVRLLIFGSLIALQVLHIYWFYLILRVAAKMQKGIKGDIRDQDAKED